MGARWTPDDDAVLRAAVRVHGCKWDDVAAQFSVPRTGNSCRQRWKKHVRQHPAAVPVASAAVPGTVVSGSLEWRPLPAPVVLGRSRSGGRPWSYYVRSIPPARPRTASYRQALLIRLWKLDEPAGGMILCNLKRAEGIVRRRLAHTVPKARLRVALLCTPQSLASRAQIVSTLSQACRTVTSGTAASGTAAVPLRPGWGHVSRSSSV